MVAKNEERISAGEKPLNIEAEVKATVEKMTKESDIKKAEYEKKLKQLQEQCFDYQSYLGKQLLLFSSICYSHSWILSHLTSDRDRIKCHALRCPADPWH